MNTPSQEKCMCGHEGKDHGWVPYRYAGGCHKCPCSLFQRSTDRPAPIDREPFAQRAAKTQSSADIINSPAPEDWEKRFKMRFSITHNADPRGRVGGELTFHIIDFIRAEKEASRREGYKAGSFDGMQEVLKVNHAEVRKEIVDGAYKIGRMDGYEEGYKEGYKKGLMFDHTAK